VGVSAGMARAVAGVRVAEGSIYPLRRRVQGGNGGYPRRCESRIPALENGIAGNISRLSSLGIAGDTKEDALSKADKVLDAMRSNPRDDWRINDFEVVCKAHESQGVRFLPPTRGSHFKVRFPTGDVLTIPARRPIKPIYVKRFVSIMDSIKERE